MNEYPILALLTCARVRHPVYNVALGEFVTLRDLADMVPGLIWEESATPEADVAADPSRKQGRWGAYDISRIAADAGWRPRPLADAIADYAEWLAGRPY